MLSAHSQGLKPFTIEFEIAERGEETHILRATGMVGDIAMRQARELDIVGRIWGEEFLGILPDCESEAALCAAERLRWAIEAGTHSAPIPSITISAGHAEMEEGDASITLFARADAALYDAKRAGRNRVVQAA